MNNQIFSPAPQPAKNSRLTKRSRKLLGFGLIVLSVLISIVFEYPSRTSPLDSPYWAASMLVLFVGVALLTPAPLDRKGFWAPTPMYWISGFFIAGIGVLMTMAFWFTGSDTGKLPFLSPWIPVVIVGASLINRLVRGVPWVDAISVAGDYEPRDERERAIVERATNYTYGIMVFLIFCAMTALIYVQAPPRDALIAILFTFLFFIQGFRGLLIWAMNRKTTVRDADRP